MGRLSRALLLVVLATTASRGQTDRYMVFFTDKNGTPHTLSQPSTFLSDKAIQRRQKNQVSIVGEDLPVVPGYVTQVNATGAKAFFSTRWMNGVLVEATPAQRTSIEALPFVQSTEFVAPNHRLMGGRKASWNQVSSTTDATDSQLSMLGLDSMHADGYRGEGVMIAVLDSGFPGVESTPPFESLRADGRIRMTKDFITNSGDVYQFDEHGTNILSIMAASASGFQGGAPKADYLLFVTEDVLSEYRVEEYNWLFAAEQADSAGADVLHSSLGYNEFSDPAMDYTTAQLDGYTAVITRAATWAAQRGMLVVVSAGNEGNTGWKYITPPADADGMLAVGAVTITGVKAFFSSEGPTTDGRIKPDLTAPGAGVKVINSAGEITSVGGTSAAAPLVSSLAAGLIQVYPTVPAGELINDMRQSASRSLSPDNQYGYGIPGYKAVRNYRDNTAMLAVYPNPVTHTLWLTIRPGLNPDRISVQDMLGKVVMTIDDPQITWANSTSFVDVSALGSGFYLLWIEVGDVRFTFRFVKL